MDVDLIYAGKATLEDLMQLNGLGFEFVVNNGKVTEIIREGAVYEA